MKRLVFILIINLVAKSVSITSNKSVISSKLQTNSFLLCGFCECLQIDCTLLSNPDIDCAKTFSNTCETPDAQSLDPNCQVACDCCISGECLQWYNYFCFIYRAYQFMTVIYFAILVFWGILLKRLATHFFSIVTFSENQNIRWEKDSKILRVRYHQIVSIKYAHDFEKKNTNHFGFRLAIELFDAIKAKKQVALFNLNYFFLILFFFFITCGFASYALFVLPSSPKMFSNIFWVVNFCGFILMILVLFGFGFIKAYRIEVLKVIFEFEENYGCKVQVFSKLKLFYFRFKKQVSFTPKNLQKSVNSLNDIITIKVEGRESNNTRVVLSNITNRNTFSDVELY